ncbi:MAG: hypothetical protein ABL878_07790 [Burkholderiales bacterium]
MLKPHSLSIARFVAHATVGLMLAPPLLGYAQSVEADFRGCDVSGICRFRVEAPHPPGQAELLVRPEGIPQSTGDPEMALALRDRLNALLSNMIHQAKRIELHSLREIGDGTFAATVTVHGVDVALDPIIVELRAKKIRRPRPPD